MRAAAAGLNVVITGAAHGIGAALARRLASRGARLVVNDIDQDGLAALADEVSAVAVPGDSATASGATQLVSRAREAVGRIDVWFGNAGIDRGRGLTTSPEDWEEVNRVNVMSHVHASRLLVPEWIRNGGGRYVVTASAAGLLTMLGSPAYSTTKHAAVAFAEWLSVSYRHHGIVVQAICPQGVRTRLYEESGLEELLGHDDTLTPEQVADAAIDALGHDRFLVLPHPKVARYYAQRATATDDWLRGMNRLQQKLEQQGVLPGAGPSN